MLLITVERKRICLSSCYTRLKCRVLLRTMYTNSLIENKRIESHFLLCRLALLVVRIAEPSTVIIRVDKRPMYRDIPALAKQVA